MSRYGWVCIPRFSWTRPRVMYSLVKVTPRSPLMQDFFVSSITFLDSLGEVSSTPARLVSGAATTQAAASAAEKVASLSFFTIWLCLLGLGCFLWLLPQQRQPAT